MTKAPRISDAIELALSNTLATTTLLWTGHELRDEATNCPLEEASCLAIEKAIIYLKGRAYNGMSWCQLVRFTLGLGLNQCTNGLEEEFPRGEIRQGARALWLMFVLEYLKDNPDEDYLL